MAETPIVGGTVCQHCGAASRHYLNGKPACDRCLRVVIEGVAVPEDTPDAS